MPRPSQITLLVEDSHHQQLLYNYLLRSGVSRHAIRILKSPSGAGSAEQWVREQFPVEVNAYRSRQAETRLIVVIDADTHSVQDRMSQLDNSLREAEIAPISLRNDRVARLISKRNVETWILCLNDERVDEDTDYKTARKNWTELIRAAAGELYRWARPGVPLSPLWVGSLQAGIRELRRIEL